MIIELAALNWLAIALCVAIGQIILTVWFAALFAEPWAKAYGAADKTQHAAEIPMYTYGVGLVCMILLTLGLATLRNALGITGFASGLSMGLFVALAFCCATAVPGYAFLRRWPALILAIAPQVIVIVALSIILSVWV